MDSVDADGHSDQVRLMMNPRPHVSAATPQLLLLVDPDEDTRDLYRSYLIPRRYVVQQACDGREALAKAVIDPPDVVVTEVRVPDRRPHRGPAARHGRDRAHGRRQQRAGQAMSAGRVIR
jgi:CheY-like chemotaxis protein